MSSNTLQREVDPFTMVTNSILNDATISLSAKGLYAFMRSKPDNWNFTIRSMAKQLKEGQTAIGNYLKELRSLGWVVYEKNQDGTGVYYIKSTQLIDLKPEQQNPNQGLCNMQKPKRISNTDLYSNKDSSKSSIGVGEFDFSKWPNKPSQDLWIDFEKVRKSKRAPITQRVVDNLGREISKAAAIGMTVDDCMNELLDRGWSTFRFEWVNKGSKQQPKQNTFTGQVV